MKNQHCGVYFSFKIYVPKFKPLLSLLTRVCYVIDLIKNSFVYLTFVYIKTAVSSEPWEEKGPGLLINSMLKKIIQTELTIIPPTEIHERVWISLPVLPARRLTRIARDQGAEKNGR